MTHQKKWLISHPWYNKLWKQANKDKINKRRRELYQKSKAIYQKLDQKRKYNGIELIKSLKNVPCFDCKTKHPHYVMHFDHRDPKNKRRMLSRMSTYSENSIREEASKCDVVCANCHAERTHKAILNGKIKVFGRYYVEK